MSEVVNLGKYYLGSPCCIRRFPLEQVLKKIPYDPWILIDCPHCASESEINSWAWYEKVRIEAYRPLKHVEISPLITVVTKPRDDRE